MGSLTERRRGRWLPALRRALVAMLVLPALLTAADRGGRALAVSYPPGWNLVAGPEGSVLFGAVSPIYSLQPGDLDYETFPATAPLHGGWGYWAFFPNGGTIDLAPGVATYSVTPVPGQWIMVGNPSAGSNAVIIGADVQSEEIIAPGHGAFVMASGPVSVVARGSQALPGVQVVAPTASPTPRITAQSQPGARCNDGSFDYSGSLSACSARGGVAYWIPGLPEERIDGTGPPLGGAGQAGGAPGGAGGGTAAAGGGVAGSVTPTVAAGAFPRPTATATGTPRATASPTPVPTAMP